MCVLVRACACVCVCARVRVCARVCVRVVCVWCGVGCGAVGVGVWVGVWGCVGGCWGVGGWVGWLVGWLVGAGFKPIIPRPPLGNVADQEYYIPCYSSGRRPKNHVKMREIISQMGFLSAYFRISSLNSRIFCMNLSSAASILFSLPFMALTLASTS